MMKRMLLPALLLLGAWTFAADGPAAELEKWSKAEHRSAENIARNDARHPVETLTFFGVKEDMRVVEINPGGGWYMDILAPFLRAKGTYVAAINDPMSSSVRSRMALDRFMKRVADKPEVYNRLEIATFAGNKLELGESGSADMVLTFRNVHNWMGGGFVTDSFAAFYDVLKPGGVLGVVEHRGANGSEQDPKAGSGYVNQEYLIKLAENAGFILVATSEVNANAKDDKNHDSGVWSLPPVSWKADENGGKYKSIGESDRATLKFVKP